MFDKNLVIARRFLDIVSSEIKSINSTYQDYYKKNIGILTKGNGISFAGYVVTENIEPRENSTEMLDDKKTFILKMDNTYIPFRLKRSIVLDDSQEEEYIKKYPKIKGCSASELINRLFATHGEELKNKKISKSKINSMPLEEASRFLSENNITFLEDALSYYNIKRSESISTKRGVLPDGEKDHPLYKNFETIIGSNKKSNEKLVEFARIKREVESDIESMIVKIDRDPDLICESDFLSKTNRTTLELISVPKSQKLVSLYCETGVDLYRVKKQEMGGYEEAVSFMFYSPAQNLSELASKINDVNYAQSMSFSQKIGFEREEPVQLRI